MNHFRTTRRNQKYILVLNEENAGASSHPIHKGLTEDILNGWIKLLDNVSDKNKIANNLTEEEVSSEQTIDISTLSKFKNIPEDIYRDYKLTVGLVIGDKKMTSPFQGAALTFDKKNRSVICIELILNPTTVISFALKQKLTMEGMAAHEATHFIKHVYDEYQADVQYFKDKKSRKEYLSYKSELEANIPKINVELKSVIEKYPDMKYIDAINVSPTFREYQKYVFDYDKESYKKVLRKTIYYWKKELNGEVK